MTALDPRELRTAFGRFMTGVAVVTTRAPDGAPLGFTANSFSSVSLDPPLLLVCPGKFLSSHATFAACRHFAVNILAEGQEAVSNIFASFRGDRFARVSHHDDLHGIPVLDGVTARFSCVTHKVVDAGDHAILLGRVAAFEHNEAPGLGYVGGRYFSLGLERAALENTGGSTVCGALIEQDGGLLLEQTPHGYRVPQIILSDWSNLRGSLADGLRARGIQAEIGQAYSVFDDRDSGRHCVFFLAAGAARPGHDELRIIPFSDLPGLTCAQPTTARMLTRYALEARTRSFSLYLGGAQSGDIHSLPERT